MPEAIVDNWRLAAVAAVFTLLWSWESIRPFFSFEHRVVHTARNLTVAGLNALVVALVFAAATVAAAAYAERTGTGLLHWVGTSEPGRFGLALLLLDCWSYWWHRANHVVPLLWRFHRMHHSDPAMDVSTATRFHLGEIAASSVLRMGLIVLLGIPLAALLLYDFVLLVSTQFHHSNIALPRGLDRLLRVAVVSPNMHKVHHSEVRAEMDSNFTSVLSVWDRLFGTFRGLDDCREIRFGVPGFSTERFQTIPGLLRTPLESRPDRRPS